LLSLTFKGNLLFRLLFQSLKELLHLTIVKLLFVWVGKDRKVFHSNKTRGKTFTKSLGLIDWPFFQSGCKCILLSTSSKLLSNFFLRILHLLTRPMLPNFAMR
jgi:hypothetical protein